MIKKIFVIIFSILFVFFVGCADMDNNSQKKPLSANVFVTIFDGNNSPALTYKQIKVIDTDKDGKISIEETLSAAHKEYYVGENGYSVSTTQYGKSINTLWGYTDDSYSFSYYLNDSMASGLDDEVREGDFVCAYHYVYGIFSDYVYFDIKECEIAVNQDITLTLYKVGFDENWQEISSPLANANIIIDNQGTTDMTNENGQITLSFQTGGTHIVSASGVGPIILPISTIDVK